jgi:hypothetical protein
MRVPNSFPTLTPSAAHTPPKWCELSYTELSDFYHDLLGAGEEYHSITSLESLVWLSFSVH